MVKRSKTGEDGSQKPAEKKSKRSLSTSTPQISSTANFSLFAGAADKELDDVFSKSATFAKHPAAASATDLNAIASSSRTTLSDNQPAPTNPVQAQIGGKAKGKGISKSTREAPAPVSSSSVAASRRRASAIDEEADEKSEKSGSEDDDQELVHESLKQPFEKPVKSRPTTIKYTPSTESTADKDRRTLFVGNLPIEVAKSKSALHRLQAHLLSFALTAKFESWRFRSVAFATPTAALPGEGTEDDETLRAKREKDRAAAWRAQQDILEMGDEKAKEEVDKAKSYIDAKGKRKVAFIKKDFHSELASCNAYFVFSHPHPDRPKNVVPILDPYEAASKILTADGSTFMNRTIRVDTVRSPSAFGLHPTFSAVERKSAWLPSNADPKNSMFVGGLDYAAKEEDLRVFFEELIKGERGERKDGRWVTGVRIIRDKETQLGKGFGYLHLADRECVDELLAIDTKKMRFAKKYLRVQRCKTAPTATSTVKAAKIANSSTVVSGVKSSARVGVSAGRTDTRPSPSARMVMPKGDPRLGEKLKGLSKDERKVAKSTDADRQARRMAKKKMRGVMSKQETGAVKLGLSRGEKMKGKGKQTMRAKKSRVRSEAAAAKVKGQRV